MTGYLFYAFVWLLISFLVFKALGPLAVCIYGVLSIGGAILYGVTRKR